jgi:hypothetical protein
VLLPIADDGGANLEQPREIGVCRRIGCAIGAAGVHFGLEFAEQRRYIGLVRNDHVVHRRERSDERSPRSLGENRTAIAFQLSRTCVGINRHNEQVALLARSTEVADVPSVKQIKDAIGKYDPAPRATMFFEYFMQTAAGENFIARIH